MAGLLNGMSPSCQVSLSCIILKLDYLIQLFTINTVYCFSCSLNCWNDHKTVECSTVIEKVQEKVDSELLSLYNFPTEDTVPLEKLKLLGK